VKRSRNEFLAGTRFSTNQHGRRHAIEQIPFGLHNRANSFTQ